MSTSSDIWVAFARTFSMLLLVLAALILVFYLIRKFSIVRGVKGGKNYIKVISVHHLAPKEKLVLLDVLGDIILIGVTPTHISKIALKDKDIDISKDETETAFNFSDFLAQKLGRSNRNKENNLSEKGGKE